MTRESDFLKSLPPAPDQEGLFFNKDVPDEWERVKEMRNNPNGLALGGKKTTAPLILDMPTPDATMPFTLIRGSEAPQRKRGGTPWRKRS